MQNLLNWTHDSYTAILPVQLDPTFSLRAPRSMGVKLLQDNSKTEKD